ncbi:UvrD-helicase domain-containing protein [Desulfocurvibacter africanus]|uniref:UvrD-helicase domain-containing protein n=1 Tax=Desulfocurvibacter africanus TaxID=873 RepID=UPI000426E3FC|nr:UvrD-helicase domain-containing protein [Desulfocurvibacter africanus]
MGGPRFIQIRASAGSGKTFALTRRFLELLRASRPFMPPSACGAEDPDGFAWPEIMAVTFTNKAATEMKERVVAALKGRALGLDSPTAQAWSPELAALFLERILRHYHLLNIRTIDSLLSRLVQMFALDLGLPPDFEAVFDDEELFGPLYDALLAAARDPSRPEAALLERSMDSLLHLERVNGFWLQERLRDRLKDVFTHVLRSPCKPLSDATELSALLADYHADFTRVAAEVDAALAADDIKLLANFRKYLDYCLLSKPEDEPKDSVYAAKESIVACLPKACQGLAMAEHEQVYARFREQAEAYRTMWTALTGAGRLAPFLDLAQLLLGRLADQERELGLVLASAWPLLASRLLGHDGGVPEAFCRLGVTLRHLLMDEFQDTSRDQWRAVLPLAQECLSRGGSLLYVGDVKQAIYGWRGGEARLFEEVGSDVALMAIAGLEQEELVYNWRSRRQVVEFNNAFFGLLESSDNARAVAEVLLPDSAPEDAKALLAEDLWRSFAMCRQQVPAKNHDATGLVRVRTVAASSADELETETHGLLTSLIEDLRERGRDWAEIAILVRSNAQAALVAGWLLEEGTPVITENSLELASHPLVRQLVAFLAFLDYPLDGLAFWQCLQGEELFLDACGRSRQEFADWLAGQDTSSVAWRFRRDFPDLWEAWFAPFLSRAGLMSPYDLVMRALDIFGVLRRRPEDEPFAQRFLEVLHRAEERGFRSLSTFLDFWRRKGGEERLPMPEHVDAVRILTIHKSKGLEFPVAIVPFHHWPAGPDHSLAQVGDPAAGASLLVPMRKELGPQYWQRQCQGLLEQVNLLYVAWTRASEELHAFVPPEGLTRATLVTALDLMLGLAGRSEEDALMQVGQPPRRMRQEEVAPLAKLHSAQAVQAETTPANTETLVRWLPRLKVYRHFSADTQYGFTQSERGNVFHAALEYLVWLGADGDICGEAMESAVAKALSLYPLSKDLREQAADELRQGLGWFLGLPQAAHWLRNGRPETSLLNEDGKVLRADLLVELDNELHVIDFKTGMPASDHREQVLGYMRLVARADGRPVRGYLAYLDRRELQEVIPGTGGMAA